MVALWTRDHLVHFRDAGADRRWTGNAALHHRNGRTVLAGHAQMLFAADVLGEQVVPAGNGSVAALQMTETEGHAAERMEGVRVWRAAPDGDQQTTVCVLLGNFAVTRETNVYELCTRNELLQWIQT